MAILGLGNGNRYKKLVSKAKDAKKYASHHADAAIDHRKAGIKLEDSAKGRFSSFKGAKRKGADVNYKKSDTHRTKSLEMNRSANRQSKHLDSYKGKVNKARVGALKATALTAGAAGAAYTATNQKKDR